MQVWSLPGSPAAGVASVLPALVSGIAGADFAARTLARLNDALPAASWSVYRLRRDGPPRLHLSASHGVADTTVDCFATYSNSGLYRDDRSFAAAEASAQAGNNAVGAGPGHVVGGVACCGRWTAVAVQGDSGSVCRPAVSGSPNIKFMHCTACPAAPLTRLSWATSTTTVSPPCGRCRAMRSTLLPGEPSRHKYSPGLNTKKK